MTLRAYNLLEKGVAIVDPEKLDIRGKLSCGDNVTIDINVIIEGNVILEDGVSIGASCILKDCIVGNKSIINSFSIVDDANIGKSSFIGPYAQISPGTVIGDKVQIGNFVEIKNSTIDSKCRINHLSFIADSDLSDNVTIGAGTITCNHNGIKSNRIQIKNGAFIGSGTTLIAPLIVNAKATIAAGSTITNDVPEGTLTLARSKQVTIPSWERI